MDTTTATKEYRAARRSIRNLSGNTAATPKARRRHESRGDHAYAALQGAGRVDILGMLQEEETLLDRLHLLTPTQRPELRERLVAVRREIRQAVAS